ncbi:MAG: excinuclease ABC subunit A, partial [Bacteroidetes bacterium SW_11_45_7]
VKDIFTPALKRELGKHGNKPGAFENITGATEQVDRVELIDQQPLGKSSRSNPVTYIKSYDAIRELFANQQLAKIKGLKPKHFSFNVDGGRCETCKGEGEVVVEMQFLADVHLTCEECNGKRFKDEVLEVTYKDKSIADVLEMTVDEAIVFFQEEQNIARQLQPLEDVGLGYVKLGQSSSTLSGGEAQRVKLASFLGRGQSEGAILFIFDEPTTGLHFHDINKLLGAFSALINNGHTVIVIEHNMEIVKSADYVIDLGPEGGDEGGCLLYQGEPEGLVNVDASHTAPFLAKHLNTEE